MFAYVAYLFLSWGQVAAQQAPDMPPLELPKIVRPATEAGSATQVSEIPFFRPARLSAVAEEETPAVKRTTILLLGVDARPGQKIARTDTIILRPL